MAEKAAHATVVNATYSKDGQKTNHESLGKLGCL